MEFDRFWQLIEASRVELPPLDQHERLEALLETLPPEEILDFDRIFTFYSGLAYRAKLWAAFFIAEGGCSDDHFTDCRSALIAAGQEAFDRIVVDPDLLAEHPDIYGYEQVGYAAVSAYETATGAPMPDVESEWTHTVEGDAEYGRLGLDPEYRLDDDPIMALDFENESAMQALLPRVWAAYGPK